MSILAVDEVMLREPRLLVPGMQPLSMSLRTRQPNDWTVCASLGNSNLNTGTPSVPASRAKTACYGGLGYTYTKGVSADTCVMPTMPDSNSFTMYAVIYLTTAVPWGGIIYDREGFNGIALGDDGLSYRYLFDGSEWTYDTGLTLTLNSVIALGHTILPDRVICFCNKKINVRTVSNLPRTWANNAGWFGSDPLENTRVITGKILLAGITFNPWLESKANAFLRDPFGELFLA